MDGAVAHAGRHGVRVDGVDESVVCVQSDVSKAEVKKPRRCSVLLLSSIKSVLG